MGASRRRGKIQASPSPGIFAKNKIKIQMFT
jgi:hypothetical protein